MVPSKSKILEIPISAASYGAFRNFILRIGFCETQFAASRGVFDPSTGIKISPFDTHRIRTTSSAHLNFPLTGVQQRVVQPDRE